MYLGKIVHLKIGEEDLKKEKLDLGSSFKSG